MVTMKSRVTKVKIAFIMHGFVCKEINYGLIGADQGIGARNSEVWSENYICLKNSRSNWRRISGRLDTIQQ
jgi:hypothetical protein